MTGQMNQNLTAKLPEDSDQLPGDVEKIAATQTSCRKSRYRRENCSNSDQLPQLARYRREKVQNTANLKLSLHAAQHRQPLRAGARAAPHTMTALDAMAASNIFLKFGVPPC